VRGSSSSSFSRLRPASRKLSPRSGKVHPGVIRPRLWWPPSLVYLSTDRRGPRLSTPSPAQRTRLGHLACRPSPALTSICSNFSCDQIRVTAGCGGESTWRGQLADTLAIPSAHVEAGPSGGCRSSRWFAVLAGLPLAADGLLLQPTSSPHVALVQLSLTSPFRCDRRH